MMSIQPHADFVGLASIVTCKDADCGSGRESDGNRAETDAEVNADSVEYAGIDVFAEDARAEEMIPGWGLHSRADLEGIRVIGGDQRCQETKQSKPENDGEPERGDRIPAAPVQQDPQAAGRMMDSV